MGGLRQPWVTRHGHTLPSQGLAATLWGARIGKSAPTLQITRLLPVCPALTRIPPNPSPAWTSQNCKSSSIPLSSSPTHIEVLTILSQRYTSHPLHSTFSTILVQTTVLARWTIQCFFHWTEPTPCCSPQTSRVIVSRCTSLYVTSLLLEWLLVLEINAYVFSMTYDACMSLAPFFFCISLTIFYSFCLSHPGLFSVPTKHHSPSSQSRFIVLVGTWRLFPPSSPRQALPVSQSQPSCHLLMEASQRAVIIRSELPMRRMSSWSHHTSQLQVYIHCGHQATITYLPH